MPTAEAATSLDRRIEEAAARVEQSVIACRRDIHQNPELGNREFRTAKLIAEKLRGLGIETKTGVAHTGVVGILRGKKPGRVVALRARARGRGRPAGIHPGRGTHEDQGRDRGLPHGAAA